MRKIVLNLAISLDGYIADKDGGFAWIKGHDDSRQNTEKKFDFDAFLRQTEVVVMGSKAYEDCPEEQLEVFKNKHILVATSRNLTGTDNIEFVNGDICARVLDLQNEGDNIIWLYGGGGLTDAFIKADIVDEYIVGIIPIILGEGIPLFRENNPTLELHLNECFVEDGIPIFKYTRR